MPDDRKKTSQVLYCQGPSDLSKSDEKNTITAGAWCITVAP